MAEQNGSSAKQQESEVGASTPQQPRPKLSKSLPTDRITFNRQLEVLKAWASSSVPQGKTVTNAEAAKLIDLNPSTISLANPFFSSVNLLSENDNGYVPAPEVFAYLRALEWNPDTAAQKLQQLFLDSWFWQKLHPTLRFKPVSEESALAMLADESNASPEHKPRLKLLLEYLITVGLIQRDGEMLKLVRENASASEPAKEVSTSPAPPKQNVTTSFAQSQEGAINFHISVRVNMEEFSTWRPDRITAFFGGIAQMLAAKAKIEKGGSE